MSGSTGTKQPSSTKPRLEFETPANELHSYEQVKIHTVLDDQTNASDHTLNPGSSAPNPRQSQHKYDVVDFNNEQPGDKAAMKEPPNTEYEVPRPVSLNQVTELVAVTSEYNVPTLSASRDQYMALGDRNASSEYKVPVRRKKKILFGKKTESQTHITQDDNKPDYEEGRPERQSIKMLSGLNVTGCVRIVLLCVAIGVAVLALVISFVSIGVSSSKSCDCPSPLGDSSMLDTTYNCTTFTVSTCNITQSTSEDPPHCLTSLPDLSSFSSSTRFQCTVDPNGKQRPIATSMVYEDIITETSSSQSVQCLCSIVVGNETQLVSSNVECVLKATECSVAVVNRRN